MLEAPWQHVDRLEGSRRQRVCFAITLLREAVPFPGCTARATRGLTNIFVVADNVS